MRGVGVVMLRIQSLHPTTYNLQHTTYPLLKIIYSDRLRRLPKYLAETQNNSVQRSRPQIARGSFLEFLLHASHHDRLDTARNDEIEE